MCCLSTVEDTPHVWLQENLDLKESNAERECTREKEKRLPISLNREI